MAKSSKKTRSAKREVAKKRNSKKHVAKRLARRKQAVLKAKAKTKRRSQRSPNPAPALRTLTQQIIVAASPQDVYDAYTDVTKHSEFTGSPATGSTAPGETMTAWDGHISAKTISLTPGRKIVQEWTTVEWPAGQPPSVLELLLEDHSGGTLLTMTHSAIPAAQAEGYRTGWTEHYWEPLKRYFSRQPEPNDAA